MNNTLPLVSVILTTYNSTLYLEEAIKSIVVDQTYPNIELIVVDDHSSNETVQKILALQKCYQFKLILLNENSGSAAKPTNEGIKVAKGKYIAVCAHDDFYLPDKIASQVNFLENNSEYSAVYSKVYIIHKNEEQRKTPKTLKCHGGLIFSDIILQRFYIPAITVMAKKEVFDHVGKFEEQLLIEDWDMWLRIANVFKIGFIDEYHACYRLHGLNSSLVYAQRMIKDRLTIIEKWKHHPHYHAALAISRLLDGLSIKQSFLTLFKDTWLALINLKQPYRVMRLFLSNFKRYYFTAKA